MNKGTNNFVLKVLDKWKILIDPLDRTSFHSELQEIHNAGFDLGYLKGSEDGIEEYKKKEAAKSLPLERSLGIKKSNI